MVNVARMTAAMRAPAHRIDHGAMLTTHVDVALGYQRTI